MNPAYKEIESIREALADDIYKKVVALYFQNLPSGKKNEAFIYLEAAKVFTLAYNKSVKKASILKDNVK